MPRTPRRENTARNARNRLMIDHSPPRDMRKRKFQKLDRTSGGQQSYSSGINAFTTRPVASVSRSMQTSSLAQLPIGNVEGHHDIPGSLPVKNKVRLLFRALILRIV